MSAIGGSIESVTLDGQTFAVPADAEAQRKIGGFENEVASNGDGSARIIKTRVPLALDGLSIETDDDKGDHEFLQDLADRSEYWPMTITMASGVIWQATAIITGEMQNSSQSATTTISLMGPGKLTRQ